MRYTLLFAAALTLSAQTLPTKWEELTAADFVAALKKSQGTCVLPFGIIEKHGPHLPLGTDLINVRWAAEHGVEQEYSIVFPAYYFGQIFEARHEPGTVAYSARLQLDLLQETTDEMGRNGCKKILIVNGHGGNNHLLPYFAQAQLSTPRDYVVYVHTGGSQPTAADRPKLHSNVDSHAGESETAHLMITRPDLLHMERATSENGADLNRLDLPRNVYTGIWWYAKFPDHYAGDGAAATKELGEYDMKSWASNVASALRAIKADQISPRLQREFFERSTHPLDTKQ
jgi:creatinine amidohydrolase